MGCRPPRLNGKVIRGAVEVVDDHDGGTVRAVTTLRFARAVDMRLAFQKKSRRGVATPKAELDRISRRLRQAREDDEQRSSGETPTPRQPQAAAT